MGIEEKLNKILLVSESNELIHPSKPGKFAEEIKDTSEKAYQRAILFNRNTKLKDKTDNEVIWYDIELPVVLNKNSRRQCIDLIGYENNRFVLCELKFNNKKDSPIAATRELLEYYRLILKNAQYLDKYSIHHSNDMCNKDWQWTSILKDDPLLVIAANEKYWKYWIGKENLDFDEQLKEIKAWSIELGIDIVLYKTEDFDFISQRNNQPSYWPKLDTVRPWVRIN